MIGDTELQLWEAAFTQRSDPVPAVRQPERREFMQWMIAERDERLEMVRRRELRGRGGG